MPWLDDLVLDEISSDRVRAHLLIRPDHQQPFGIVHGGVWCSVVETVASAGAHHLARERFGSATCVGVANQTDFLRSMREGTVDVVGQPVHAGRTQQLWQVEITRADDGALVARGQVRLQNLAESPR